PRGDRRGLVAALGAIQHRPEAVGGRTDLARAVTALGRVARHRGLVAILSDFPLSPGLEQALRVLARKHEIGAMELRVPRGRALPGAGPLSLRDVETGRGVLVDTADPKFVARFRAVNDATDTRRADILRRVGARHVVLSTDGDWVLPLARELGRPPRLRGAAAGASRTRSSSPSSWRCLRRAP